MNHIADMFQTYDVTGGPEFGRKHLPKLRAEMAAAGLDLFLVPHEDCLLYTSPSPRDS